LRDEGVQADVPLEQSQAVQIQVNGQQTEEQGASGERTEKSVLTSRYIEVCCQAIGNRVLALTIPYIFSCWM
jgi:hypothetical protein